MPKSLSFANETQSSWFIQLRWIAVGVGFDGALVFWLLFPAYFTPLPFLGLFAGLALLNLGYAWAQRRLKLSSLGSVERARRLHWLLDLQIAGDLLALFFLLLDSGGLQNPLVFLYLLHIVIASILFPPKESLRYALVVSFFPWVLFLLAWGGWTPTRLAFWPYQFSLTEEASRLTAFLVVAGGLWLIVSRLAEDLRGTEAELKVSGQDLSEARNKLLLLENHRAGLLGNLARELKPPIQALERDLGKAEKTAAKEKVPALVKLLRGARMGLSGLRDVSGDLDWLAAPEWPQRVYRREWMDLAALAHKTLAHWGPAASAKNLRLRLEGAKRLVLPADRLALQQVLFQLVGNAVKYSHAGGGDILIEIKMEKPYALLSVADRGMGIPEEDRAGLFNEFFRGKKAEGSGEAGSGLGLFIVKKILDWHHGIIQVASEWGKGTTVKVWLPLGEHGKAGEKPEPLPD